MSGQFAQNLVVAGIALAATGYLARRAWVRLVAARRPHSSSCGPECGCGKSDY